MFGWGRSQHCLPLSFVLSSCPVPPITSPLISSFLFSLSLLLSLLLLSPLPTHASPRPCLSATSLPPLLYLTAPTVPGEKEGDMGRFGWIRKGEKCVKQSLTGTNPWRAAVPCAWWHGVGCQSESAERRRRRSPAGRGTRMAREMAGKGRCCPRGRVPQSQHSDSTTGVFCRCEGQYYPLLFEGAAELGQLAARCARLAVGWW